MIVLNIFVTFALLLGFLGLYIIWHESRHAKQKK